MSRTPDTAVLTGAMPVYQTKPSEMHQFLEALKKVENAPKIGYDISMDAWQPHASLEGGTDTIGYGHKLRPSEHDKRKVMIRGLYHDFPVADSAISELFLEDVEFFEKLVQEEWKENKPESAYSWMFMEPKYRAVLVNVAFNVGTTTAFKKLYKAIETRDNESVRREMVTSYKNPQGHRIKLTKRAQIIADALEL